ncbi:MAG TPA: hypothetical protein VFQ00_11095 [Terriglobales bacterium]|nr:hypothetical protein [Terriglobales bacterium]
MHRTEHGKMFAVLDGKPHRRVVLIVAGSMCTAGSIPLFWLKPIPPIGIDAAIGLALGALVCLSCAFFPKQFLRIERRIERAVERDLEKEQHASPGQWVP